MESICISPPFLVRFLLIFLAIAGMAGLVYYTPLSPSPENFPLKEGNFVYYSVV
ncbi:MAG: hypothetical protein AB4290_13800 [Spirulina sp.]